MEHIDTLSLEEYLDSVIEKNGLAHLCTKGEVFIEAESLRELLLPTTKKKLKELVGKGISVKDSAILTKAAVVLSNTDYLERFILYKSISDLNTTVELPINDITSSAPSINEMQNEINSVMRTASEVFKEKKTLTAEEFRAIYIAIFVHTQDIEAIKKAVGESVYYEYFRQAGYYLQKYKKEIPAATAQFQKELSA